MASSDANRSGDPGAPPWWAEGGSEVCPFCDQLYVYELEVRCIECDEPSCPHCAVFERLTTVRRLCPGCCSTEEGEG